MRLTVRATIACCVVLAVATNTRPPMRAAWRRAGTRAPAVLPIPGGAETRIGRPAARASSTAATMASWCGRSSGCGKRSPSRAARRLASRAGVAAVAAPGEAGRPARALGLVADLTLAPVAAELVLARALVRLVHGAPQRRAALQGQRRGAGEAVVGLVGEVADRERHAAGLLV